MSSKLKMLDIEKAMRERQQAFPHIEIPINNKEIALPDETISASKSYNPKSYLASYKDNIVTDSIPIIAETEQDIEKEKYITPSTYLKKNIFPEIDATYMISYMLSLDIRRDAVLVENHKPEYQFQFSKFGNISTVEIVSVIVSNNHNLDEPYLFIDIKELDGRCLLANGKKTFGKIVLLDDYSNTANKLNVTNTLRYVPEQCFQQFSEPICLDKLSISFCDYQGSAINIKEVKVIRLRKSKDTITVECGHQHFLKEKDKLEVHIIKEHSIISYDAYVETILDNTRFEIKNQFDDLTSKIKIYKTNIVISITFKFSEINTYILNDESPLTCQLIKLSQLVQNIKDKNKMISDK